MSAFAVRDNMPIPTNFERAQLDADRLIQELQDSMEGIAGQIALFSCEHFSYFRDQKEIDKLKMLLPPAKEFHIIFVRRNNKDFMRSYKEQITRTGHGPSLDPSSPYYCGEDSWLLEDAKIKTLWDTNFTRITVLNYNKSGMIGQLWTAMDLPAEMMHGEIYHNLRPAPRIIRFASKILPTSIKAALKASYIKFRSML